MFITSMGKPMFFTYALIVPKKVLNAEIPARRNWEMFVEKVINM
jgi:hypothetical protein